MGSLACPFFVRASLGPVPFSSDTNLIAAFTLVDRSHDGYLYDSR